ncbi:serine/threonine protein phosphatase, partial [Streptomyces sp. NPDC059525]
MTEYPTSQEGPQPTVAPGGGTDELGHGKAPIAAAEAVRTHADFPRPRGTAGDGSSGHGPADSGDGGARTRDGEAARNAGRTEDAQGPAAGTPAIPATATAAGGQGSGPAEAGVARREGDRLRFVGAAT